MADNEFLAGWQIVRNGITLSESAEQLSDNQKSVETFLVELQDEIREFNVSSQKI